MRAPRAGSGGGVRPESHPGRTRIPVTLRGLRFATLSSLALAWGSLALSGCAPPPPEAELLGAPDLSAELDPEARAWVEETLTSLTLAQKAGQLVIPHIAGAYWSTSDPAFLRVAGWVEEEGIGGISISIGLPHSYAAKLNEMQRRARIPLLVVSDFESGGPGMRLSGSYSLPHLLPQGGGTAFPPTMAFGAIGEERFAFELGRITGVEARAVGVHLDFAPVLDVNSNPVNPIINTRSFGEDAGLVAHLGAAFIRGAREAGLQTTGKHFPGHGDTRVDSHIELPAIPADRARLDTLELVPFQRAIREGVDAIMTAHVAAPEILGPDAPPATLSPYFLTQLLRADLDFAGLLFTDAMGMGGVTARYGANEAGVLALEAGADVILAPRDIPGVIRAVAEAVESGRVPEERLDASVRRILEAKARAGLHLGRLVDLDAIDEVVGSASHLAMADSAAVRSITLPRDRDGLVPMEPEATGRVLSITFSRREALPAGRAFDGVLAGALETLERVRVDEEAGEEALGALAARARGAELVLVSAYLPPRAGAGSVALPEAFAAMVRRIVATGTPTILLSFGSPYVLDAVPEVGTYLVAWGEREISQRAAARALLGETEITGRLPISLPPHHEAGEGIERTGGSR